MNTKRELRIELKNIRANLDMQSISQELCKKLILTDEFTSSKNILIYYPLKNEVDLRLLLNENKNFYLPRVCGDNLEICPYKSGDRLITSKFKLCEPCSIPISPEKIELAIVPALGVDKNNYRIGYGGGFYDRFIANNPQIKTVTLIPKELVITKIPTEPFDKKIDKIITY